MKSWIVQTAAIAAWAAGGSVFSEAEKPNVLFIAIDDMRDFAGYFHAHPNVVTPCLDRLSAKGVSFSSAYCQSPMCAASRNSLLTGVSPARSGVYGFQSRRESPVLKELVTLPRHFRENGYFTIGGGKIHHEGKPPNQNNGPDPEEWDEYHRSLQNPTFPDIYQWEDGKKSDYKFVKGSRQVVWQGLRWGQTTAEDHEHSDGYGAEWAAEQLQRTFEQPFFLAVGFTAPHYPLICPKKYFDEIGPVDGLRPVATSLDDLNVPPAGRFFARYYHSGLYAEEARMRELGAHQEALQAYLAQCRFTDEQVGKVLDALWNSPYAENTIVVLWSDHGFMLGEKECWSKFRLWIESARVPFIISGPGIAEGEVCAADVELLDIYPTLISLCGLPPVGHQLDGNDLTPLLKNPDAEWEQAALTTAGKDNHAVSYKGFRYITYFNGDQELYNVQKDPHENNNLAVNPEYADKILELRAFLPKYNAPNQNDGRRYSFYNQETYDIEKEIKQKPVQYERLRQQPSFTNW